jgi:tetratricopeptide (TPR) repeat protein
MSVGLSLLLMLCLLVAGCGGGSSKGPKSINDQLVQARKQSTPDRQAVALLRVASKQNAEGDTAGATKTAKEAFELLSGMEDANATAARLVSTAGFLAAIGDKATARKVLIVAEERVAGIGDPVRQVSVLADAGAIYGNKSTGLADSAGATSLLTRARDAALVVEERYRAEALAAVALGYTKGNVASEAASMVEQLLETARGNDNPRAKAEGLAAAANVKAQIGDADEAKTLLEEAATVAREVERTESRAYALLAVGEATAESGDKATARSVLDEAYAAADKVGDEEQRQLILAKVSRALDQLK